MSTLTRISVPALATALLLAPGLAAAQSVMAQITGIGEICTPIGNGPDSTCIGGLSLSGSIRFDVVGTASDTSQYEANGQQWVQTSFQLQWSGASSGSFVSTPYAGGVSTHSAVVFNDYPYYTDIPAADMQAAGSEHYLDTPTDGYYQFAYVQRTNLDNADWIHSLDFDTTVGLAQGPNAQNWLSFGLSHATISSDGQYTLEPGTYYGGFSLTSWTVSAVPEPGSWALFMLGALPLLPAMRRRLRTPD